MTIELLTQQQIAEFSEKGYTRVSDAVDAHELSRVSDSVWERLADAGIQKERPETWQRPKPKGLQALSKTSIFDKLFMEAASGRLDVLIGQGRWSEPLHWGQLLFSAPGDAIWSIPTAAWHLDLPQSVADTARPGAQLFICLEDVVTRCGATLVAAGSHRLVKSQLLQERSPEDLSSANIRKELAKHHDWFEKLWSKRPQADRSDYFLSHSCQVADTELRIEELVGKRGDIIFMHPFLIHAPAPNVGPNIRLALTHRIYANHGS